MIINHNMNAMTAHRQMGINTGNQGKAIEKLSSGQQINRAGDDAAGLAISEKMRGQIRGLDGASRNAQDGVSLIQTAEGGLNETHNILQRMRELSVQGANDTNVEEDREAIQKEMDQLMQEIDRIAEQTEFNGQKLLNGDFKDKNLQIGANEGQNLGLDIGKMNSDALGLNGTDKQTETVKVDGVRTGKEDSYIPATDNKIEFDSDGKSLQDMKISVGATEITIVAGKTEAEIKTAIKGEITDSEVTITDGKINVQTKSQEEITIDDIKNVNLDDFAEQIINYKDANGNDKTITIPTSTNQVETATLIETVLNDPNEGGYIGAKVTIGTNGAVTIEEAKKEVVKDEVVIIKNKVEGSGTPESPSTGKVAKVETTFIKPADGNVKGSITIGDKKVDLDFTEVDSASAFANKLSEELTKAGIANTVDDSKGTARTNANVTIKVDGDNISIESNQAIKINGLDEIGMENQTVNVPRDGISVSSYDEATASIKTIDNAMKAVSSQRADLGALQNRLEHTIATNDNSAENLQAAESRIRDVDMAKEMMNLSKNNVLVQAAQSMLAQANQQPNQVLSLLR